MTQTVVGLFNKPSEAQEAVNQLVNRGFDRSEVDLSIGSSSDVTNTQNFNLDTDNKDEHESGITRFFKNLFGSSDDDNNSDVNRYSTAARGKSIVTVHAASGDEAGEAADILDDCGAINVDENADEYNTYNTTTGAAPVGVFNETAGASASTIDTDMNTTGIYDKNKITGTSDSDDVTGKKSIPVIEEQLQVGKQTVETGGVRLKSRIVEKPVEENLRLREERVYVNRNPVNRAATDADFDAFKEGEVELRERSEVPVVNKEARIVEEVSLGKETNERNETIRDTVRKTEVDVENIEGSNKRTSTTDSDWKSGK